MTLLLFLLLAALVLGSGVVFKFLEIALIIAVILVLVGFFSGRSSSDL